MAHYQSPYHHDSYRHRDDHHHDRRSGYVPSSSGNDSYSGCSRERFRSGSSRNYDQAPSIHVTKSRDNNYVLDGGGPDEFSERSFELGLDPIERDWGDSYHMMRSSRHSASGESSLNSVSSSLHQNATYRPRTVDEDYPYENSNGNNSNNNEDDYSAVYHDAHNHHHHPQHPEDDRRDHPHRHHRGHVVDDRCRRPRRSSCQHDNNNFPDYTRRRGSVDRESAVECGSSRTGDTRSTAASTAYTSRSRDHLSKHREQRRSSLSRRYSVERGGGGGEQHSHRSGSISSSYHTALPYHPADQGSVVSGRSGSAADNRRNFMSNSSVRSSGSSVCSRSAPERRTRIAREPSLYRPGASYGSSGRRTFAHGHPSGGGGGVGGPRGSRGQPRYHHAVPPQQIEFVFEQQHHMERSDNGHASYNDMPASSDNNGGNSEGVLVDIAPGVQAPLRGTAETYKAVSKDFYGNISCFGCSKELCCIADVSYVVCPDCKVISPLEGDEFEGKEINRHGLGLGFTYDSLFNMQMEIMKDRKDRTT